eukprot:CAMPEP_0115867282 /NCGR_PEP_ID=MMETSP0287-20121206/20688_1 /TAXON_ID=412157 /ORGANISM="Chrysochromulina rotalis, Strain UIO044" /LENGTH=72 /DNA_ID=CAMNT_0003321883 /DNA_START=779 /DNA_END=997 /DNA_ORIENTATION=+
MAPNRFASISAGHTAAPASNSAGALTLAMPLQCAKIDPKTGSSDPYADASGPALPPPYSVGQMVERGNRSAK